jgi:PAS domain S-box-containing protein
MALDAQGKVLQFAPSTEKASGYAAAEMVHADPFERLFAEDATRVREALLSGTNAQPVEVRADLQARNGERRPIHWSCWRQVPTVDPVRFVVLGIDETREREFEERALQNARFSTAGVLAAGLAHEIRNPLNGASLHLSVLERDLARLQGGMSASAREAVVVVRSELRRLSSLVTDFLEVTRPKPLARSNVDVRDLARAVLAQVREAAKDRGIAVSAELPLDPAVAWIDADRMKQALLNLVQNAIEAGTRDGTVVVRVGMSRARFELEVEDDGPGIPNASAPIFDPFFTTKRTGTGLGLSIVHRTVTDHGGNVTYSSVPKRTVFRISLPVSQPA